MTKAISIDSTREAVTESAASEYRFERFKTRHALADIAFSRGAKRAGDSLSDATLYALDGEVISVRDHAAGRPLLIVTGSITCPMTASSLPDLNELHREFGDRVAFVLLNVREAHPGESFPQPHEIAGKLEHARALQARFGVDFPVLVDDIDGTLHRELDAIANSAHLVAADGKLAFRSLWAGDRASLARALADLTAGNALSRVSSSRTVGPITRAIGYIGAVLGRAGRGARRDLVFGAPPMALLSGLASLFRFAPERKRGVFAIGSLVLGLAAIATAVAVTL